MKEDETNIQYDLTLSGLLQRFAKNNDPDDPFSMLIDINGTKCRLNSRILLDALESSKDILGIPMIQATITKCTTKDPDSIYFLRHASGFEYNYHFVVRAATPVGNYILDPYLPEDERKALPEESYLSAAYENPDQAKLEDLDEPTVDGNEIIN